MSSKLKITRIGNYEFTHKRLGEGNFAKVVEALHVPLNEKVAVKVIELNEIKETYVAKNLLREVKILSKLQHENLMVLFETLSMDNTWFLVCEYIAGGDMAAHIKSQPECKLSERQSNMFIRQIVSAVAYMHKNGIVHRDLKMDNIMLNESKCRIKIIDFGLSNFWSPNSALVTHCGSPEYAAPELFINNSTYGPEVDYWSVGVIMYAMVCGELPFMVVRRPNHRTADRRLQLHQQISRGLVPAHHGLLSRFSVDFRHLIQKLITPNPKKRITLKELIRHPWITCHGRKLLDIQGYNIDPRRVNIIKREISNMLKISTKEVECLLEKEPYGMAGGYYNILTKRKILCTVRPGTAPPSLQCTVQYKTSMPEQKARPNVSVVPQHTAARAALRRSKVVEEKQPNHNSTKDKQHSADQNVTWEVARKRPQCITYRAPSHAAGEPAQHHAATPARNQVAGHKRQTPRTHMQTNRLAQAIGKYMVKQCAWAQQISKLKEPGEVFLGN